MYVVTKLRLDNQPRHLHNCLEAKTVNERPASNCAACAGFAEGLKVLGTVLYNQLRLVRRRCEPKASIQTALRAHVARKA